MADPVASSASVARRGDEVEDRLRKTLGRVGGSLISGVILLQSLLSIVHTALHNPEDITTPVGWFESLFQHRIVAPVSILIRLFAEVSGWISAVPFLKNLELLHVFTAILMSVASAIVLYASTVGLLRLYMNDDSAIVRNLRAFTVFFLKILSLPFAALAIVHIIQTHWHIRLLPLGDDILTNYRLIVHAAVEKLYWVPFHFFSWSVPPLLKDIATISIVSVGIYRKAVLRGPTSEFGLSWDEFWPAIKSLLPVRDIFDALNLLPSLIAIVLAQILGWVAVFLFLGWRWPAERLAAVVYVVVRGAMMLGILYFFEAIWFLRGRYRAKVDRSKIYRYLLYIAVAVVLTVWFFWSLRFGASVPGVQ